MDADWARLIEKRLDALESDVTKIKAMINWVIGAAAVLGVLLGAGGHTVIEKLLR